MNAHETRQDSPPDWGEEARYEAAERERMDKLDMLAEMEDEFSDDQIFTAH